MSAPPDQSGFTLIEVMISIFLTLLLIIGINEAFRVVTATVGAGQAMGSVTRDSFSAQMVFQQDIGRSLSHSADTPFLIIDSQQQVAFRNRQAFKNDRDGNPLTIDLNNNNVEGEPTVPGEKLGAEISDAVHRIDTLGFFATGDFSRQTGNGANFQPGFMDQTVKPNVNYNPAPASFAARQSAKQAYIWFGHLWLPGSTGGWYVDNGINGNPPLPSYPGEVDITTGDPKSNPNNYFASDWILGRMQILLTPGYRVPTVPMDTPLKWKDWQDLEPNALGGGAPTMGNADQDRPAPAPLTQIVDPNLPLGQPSHGLLLTAIDRPPFIAPPALTPPLITSANNKPVTDLTSYLPLARWFIDTTTSTGVQTLWGSLPVNPNYQPSASDTRTRDFMFPPADTDYAPNWFAASWDQNVNFKSIEDSRYDCAVGDFATFKRILLKSIQRGNDYNLVNSPYNWRWWESLCYRFRANPTITSPLTPDGVAQQQPIFLRHCTQFIVEFAGDFLKQSNDQYIATGAINPNYGDVADVYFDTLDPHPTDGIIDYYVDKSADPARNDPTKWTRRIRWYGFPRDTNGDGHIFGYSLTSPAAYPAGSPSKNNDLVDVVPLRDIMLTGIASNWCGHAVPSPKPSIDGAPFEKDLEPEWTNTANHAGPRSGQGLLRSPGENGGNGDYADPTNKNCLFLGSRYICAFGPVGAEQNSFGGGRFTQTANAPLVADDALTRIRLIRITIRLDDPNNRLPDGQTFQYVIALP
jgi:hypothetical protein